MVLSSKYLRHVNQISCQMGSAYVLGIFDQLTGKADVFYIQQDVRAESIAIDQTVFNGEF